MTKEQILKELKNKSEVINDSLWYVNPDDIKEAISQTREETIKEIIRSVEENQKGQFEDDGGYVCWYLDNLVDLLNKILNKLKK